VLDVEQHNFVKWLSLGVLATVLDHQGVPALLVLLVIGSTLIYLFAPPNRWAFPFLFLSYCSYLIHQTPLFTNHDLLMLPFVACVSGCILLQRTDFLGSVTFRAMVVAGISSAYFAAFFHKLNSGYTNPLYSCAIEVFHPMTLGNLYALKSVGGIIAADSLFSIVVQSKILSSLVIYGSLVWEFLMFGLLLHPKTRRVGLACALIFHVILGFREFAAFSLSIFALHVAWAGPNSSRKHQPILWGMILALVLGRSLVKTGPVEGWWIYLFDAPLMLCVAVGSISLVKSYTPLGRLESTPSRYWPVFLVVIYVLANAAGPYIGWKTIPTFSMFSNLQTHGTGNHYIMPGLGEKTLVANPVSGVRQEEIQPHCLW
jgi:hypothetical protein